MNANSKKNYLLLKKSEDKNTKLVVVAHQKENKLELTWKEFFNKILSNKSSIYNTEGRYTFKLTYLFLDGSIYDEELQNISRENALNSVLIKAKKLQGLKIKICGKIGEIKTYILIINEKQT